MSKLSLTASLFCALFSNKLLAVEKHLVYSPQNIAVFEVRFFDMNDGPFMDDWPTPAASTWDLNQQQKAKILEAMRYWAGIITPQPGELPAIVNVGTFDDVNAAGLSEVVSDGVTSITQLQGGLNGINTGELSFGSHAQFVIGKMDFYPGPWRPSQLPRIGQTDLVGLAIHELAHGLGISNMVSDQAGTFTPAFAQYTFGGWTSSLRDDNGNPASPGQTVLCQGCNNPWHPKAFDVRKDKGYFTGDHVNEVLAGAMPGIPVKMLGDYGDVDNNYMSHIELKNSLMSHQNFRNYTTFMEAELALLQDLGYQIDRRNFFGYSLYGDGKTLINRHGYFLRDGNKGIYKEGEYNTASLGVGLHVYGSHNRIYQQADLLTSGAGAAGIRVDGQNNTLFIEPGTRVHANGLNARGVLFAYGKNHNLIQRGEVQSLGMNGIALDVDFGNNLVGNDIDYRGSWMHYVNGYAAPLLAELQGALVDNVDISGQLAGKRAAIFISPNALVNNINILNGARIAGNIYSNYNQRDALGRPRLTALSFGRLADKDGRATGLPDPHFRLNYQGNIQGLDSFAVSAQGGTAVLTGSHKLYSLRIAPQAALAGYSDYTLHQDGAFINEGLLIPGTTLDKISIAGHYQQSETGELRLGFNGSGRHDTLAVDGYAELNGRLTLIPQRDWYAESWRIDSQDLLKTASRSGQFSDINGVLQSPTLTLTRVPDGHDEWQLRMMRASDAYSRYARTSNESEVGKALDQIVSQARPGIQQLYRTLDFSSADGNSVSRALRQLSPGAYSAMYASSLQREQQIANIISEPHTIPSRIKPGEDEWRSFAIPFGGSFWQQQRDNTVGYNAKSYGLIFGADKRNGENDSLVYGFHGAIGGQSVSLKAPDSGTGKTTAFNLGLHARYGFAQPEGGYLFGNARVGVEDGWLERRVRVDDYSANHKSSWTGTTGSVMSGGGYRFALNENISAGPMASLNYSVLHRGSLTESGDKGSRLQLDSSTFHSLQSSIGLTTHASYALSSGSVVTAGLQLAWNHELLDTSLSQTASFADYGAARFKHRAEVTGRNSMGIKTVASYQLNKTVELGAGVSSELFRSGYDSLSGNISVSWRF